MAERTPPEQIHRVLVEQADWRTLLPFLRLFDAFRMAIHPSKMLLALMLVLLTYLGGLGLDLVWGPQVHPGHGPDSIDEMISRDLSFFGVSRGAPQGRPTEGIFEATLDAELAAFKRVVHSASHLHFGISDFLSGEGLTSGGVIGGLADMIIFIPLWLLAEQPIFLAVFLLYAFLLTALFGGAITRLAAVQATRDLRPSPFAALRFTGRRYPWYVLAPVIPLAVAAVIGVMVAVAGLVFFNLPVLDVIGALLFGLMLLGGFVIALLVIGLLVGASLLFPALAVEGTDSFDAISRAFNYVIGRPWRYLFYTAIMLVYGAVTYLFVGLVVYLTLWATKMAAGLWVFREVDGGTNRFDAILPAPRLGELVHTVDWNSLDGSAAIAAGIVLVWVKLLIALLPAYAVSFFFCEQTWIYLLLRRSADGSEIDEVYLENEVPQAMATPEKVEPVN